MQLAIGLIVAIAFSLLALALRLIRRHSFDFDEFAQDVLISLGVGTAAGLIIVPAIGIPWAFIHNHSQLTLAMLTAYDQNGLMFSLIVSAAASAYLALKAYIDRVSKRAEHPTPQNHHDMAAQTPSQDNTPPHNTTA